MEFPNHSRAVRRPPVWAVHQDSAKDGDLYENSPHEQKGFSTHPEALHFKSSLLDGGDQ
jgi:hypothetical protein